MIDVSIIIPVYNGESTIERAINSVLAQKGVEIEIVCVDDDSKDNTWDVLTKCVSVCNKIIIFHQENGGAASARNNGILKASGRYIAFLDADDYYINENALSNMVKKCDEYRSKVCGSVMCLEENGEIHPSSSYEQILEDSRKGLISYNERQNDYDFTSYIFDREMVIEKKIKFPLLRYFEDPPFLVRVMNEAKTYVCCEDRFYCYVVSDKVSKLESPKQILSLIEGLRLNMQFAIENDLSRLFEKTIHRLLYEYGDKIYFNLIGSESVEKAIKELELEVRSLGYSFDFKRLYSRNYVNFEAYLSELVWEAENVYVFGKGKISKRLTDYFVANFGEEKLCGYVVSNKTESDGDDTMSLREYADCRENALLLIAVSGIYIGEIVDMLNYNHVTNYEIVDTIFQSEILLK